MCSWHYHCVTQGSRFDRVKKGRQRAKSALDSHSPRDLAQMQASKHTATWTCWTFKVNHSLPSCVVEATFGILSVFSVVACRRGFAQLQQKLPVRGRRRRNEDLRPRAPALDRRFRKSPAVRSTEGSGTLAPRGLAGSHSESLDLAELELPFTLVGRQLLLDWLPTFSAKLIASKRTPWISWDCRSSDWLYLVPGHNTS